MAKRRLAWGTTRFQGILTSNVTQVTDLLSSLIDMDTLTAIRIVGHLVLIPSSVSASALGSTGVDFGIGVISAEALAAPTVPDPNVNGDVPAAGWLYRSRLIHMRENNGPTEAGGFIDSVDFDIRAARKVDRGKLFFATHPEAIDGTILAVRLAGIIRVLCAT